LPDDIVVTDGDGDFQRRLGKAFSKREGRRFGDRNLHLERAGTKNRAVKWRVLRGVSLNFEGSLPGTHRK
jgi:hypothetical protein